MFDLVPYSGCGQPERRSNGHLCNIPIAIGRTGNEADASKPFDALPEFDWHEDEPLADLYDMFGRRLSQCGDLYRCAGEPDSLVCVSLSDGKPPRYIRKAPDFAGIVIDRIAVTVWADGKRKGRQISHQHLRQMLKSESFLRNFPLLDKVTSAPLLLPGFQRIMPGYNDGGKHHRLFYVGEVVTPSHSLETIKRFLDVMEFASPADYTNAVAAALTVLFRSDWPGAKPLLLATSTKSHGGKGTIITFACGRTPSTTVSYEHTDWAMQHNMVMQLKKEPEAGLIVIDNARISRGANYISSAFLERFITDPEPVLCSTGSGGPVRRRNDLVPAITTNDGKLSTDLMNRSLPIHLAPQGDVADRKLEIGNPKDEYLPKNRLRIEAELWGMIERWKAAGMPLDNEVRHPMTDWARVIGGILKVSGFENFLGNYALRRTQDDPLRQALALLGADKPNAGLRPGEWVNVAKDQGVVKDLISSGSLGSDKAQERGMGLVLSRHVNETFEVELEGKRAKLRLKKSRNRQGEGEAVKRYTFEIQQDE